MHDARHDRRHRGRVLDDRHWRGNRAPHSPRRLGKAKTLRRAAAMSPLLTRWVYRRVGVDDTARRMHYKAGGHNMTFRVVALAVFLSAVPAAAQVTERPVPFDSAGRILTVNPALVRRIQLDTPAWPVKDAYVEARVYLASTGDYVLAVQRDKGVFDRFALTPDQFAALRGEVTLALA